MALEGPDAITPCLNDDPDVDPTTHARHDGTNNEGKTDGDGKDEPPLTFADLGIPTGPQLTDTATGKRKKLEDLSYTEIAFLVISGVALLATTIFTIYKLATLDKSQPDFVFAIVLIVNAVFCSFYLVHGLRRERPYEILILVGATVIVVFYLIINYIIGVRGTIKLIRLIAACVLGPVVVVMGVLIGRDYIRTGKLIFRTVGANEALQTSCKIMYLFLDLIKLDLQLGITNVILIMVNAMEITTLDIVILTVGMVLNISWFIIGHLLVRLEIKIMTYFFWALSPVELAYITYKTIMSAQRLSIAPALAACSLAAGIMAALVHIAVIVLSCFVYRNFGKGLRKKAFGLKSRRKFKPKPVQGET